MSFVQKWALSSVCHFHIILHSGFNETHLILFVFLFSVLMLGVGCWEISSSGLLLASTWDYVVRKGLGGSPHASELREGRVGLGGRRAAALCSVRKL